MTDLRTWLMRNLVKGRKRSREELLDKVMLEKKCDMALIVTIDNSQFFIVLVGILYSYLSINLSIYLYKYIYIYIYFI